MLPPRRVIFTVDMGFLTMTPPPADNFAARVFLGPALRGQPDRHLVDLVRDGYDAAFEEIVRRYRRPLDRFAAAIVGGRSEDVTQDAFSKALLALRGSEAEIELRPWLYRIVRNTALNDLRDRAPAAEQLSEVVPGTRSAAAEVESREELAELMERLRALPEPQRAALVMRELEGLSHDEIAAALGISGGAARQAIYRARAALREGLGLLLPLPLVRALAEHADEATRAGGAIAGASVSSAGGAALSGGAVKAGLATVLVAGAVGAGVAIEERGGEGRGPEAAQAAPLRQDETRERSRSGTGPPGFGDGATRDSGRNDDGEREPADDDRSGRDDDSENSGPGSRSSGPGSDGDDDSRSGSNSGSGSGDGESSGPGSSEEVGDNSGPSPSSGSDGGGDSSGGGDDGGSSGPGGETVEPNPDPDPEPESEPEPEPDPEPEPEPDLDPVEEGEGGSDSGDEGFSEGG
jgi:RNA polymerase sigma factor (sigma-70 family)